MNIEADSTKLKILDLLKNPSNAGLKQSEIQRILGLESQGTVSEHISDLRDEGLITISKEKETPGNTDFKFLTREGRKVLYDTPHSNRPIQGDEPIFLHKFFLKFKIKNLNELEDTWPEEKWISGTPANSRYQGNDTYEIFKENWRFRVTSRHVIVHLEELRGTDPYRLKNRAMVEGFEALRFLEDESPVKCEKEPVNLDVEVNQAEIGIIGDAFAEIVDRYGEMNPSDIVFLDSEGRKRGHLDNSHGPGEKEFSHPSFSEEDAEVEVERIEDQCERPERHKWIYQEMPEEFEALQEEVQEVRDRYTRLEGIVGRLVSNQGDIIEQVRDNSSNLSDVVRLTRIGFSRGSNNAEKEASRGVFSVSPTQKGQDVPKNTEFSERGPNTAQSGRCNICGERCDISEENGLEVVECGSCGREYYRQS